jgi:hypothetical protein
MSTTRSLIADLAEDLRYFVDRQPEFDYEAAGPALAEAEAYLRETEDADEAAQV